MTTQRAAKSPYATTYHCDGTITVWSVYLQQWVRTGRPSDGLLTTLPIAERERAVRHYCGAR